MHITRSKVLVPLIALILTASAALGVSLLIHLAGSSSAQELDASSMTLTLADLQVAPFVVPRSGDGGGAAASARKRIAADEAAILDGLAASSQAGVPASVLTQGRSDLRGLETFVTDAYRLATGKGGLVAAPLRTLALDRLLIGRAASLSAVLRTISASDATRASDARSQAEIGAAAAMLLLLVAFAWFFVLSAAAQETVDRLACENEELLGYSQIEARTDVLTALGNRRALSGDLASALAAPPGKQEMLLVMYDLDGFKQYNDTFGHVAGDALLHRLGARLAAAATSHSGAAYRMGGDEFCVLAHASRGQGALLLSDTQTSLGETGESWEVGCSLGAVWMPSEATTENEALQLADERMYANKTTRSSASRQVTDALLQVVTEQHPVLDGHVERVSELSGELAEALGAPASEVSLVRLAGRLHDIGKSAIPAAILDKRGPLDDQEWAFMRRHPGIGERIVLAAPALAGAAAIIRSTHERIDGHGYPDGLSGESIPFGSRIIAVSDAFDAMTSDRPYRLAMSADAALKELRRNAGTQFDAAIVDTFCSMPSSHMVAADVAGQAL